MNQPTSPELGETVNYVRKNPDGTTTTIEAVTAARSQYSPIIDVTIKRGEETQRAYLVRADHTSEPQPGTWHYPTKTNEEPQK